MSLIRVMPKALAEQIAAGEVVERPASAAKELLENALDAGAAHITLELRRGGIEYLRVTDDGKGIAAEEVPTAFLRHATSKLYDESQLSSIATLGFRGEALAAIGAVARVEMLTKPQDALLGCRYVMENGDTHEYERTGCPNGTTVIVRDLFAEVPARYKFLKKDSSEGSAVHAMVQRLALSCPQVAFRVIRDGKTILSTPGDGDLLSAIVSTLGEKPADLIRLSGRDEDLRVEGYLSRPTACKGSRAGQYFFVNGRWIRSKLLTAALENAYKNQSMVGRFPACVLKLTIPYEDVDVNSHPAKTEVRFAQEQRLFRLVYHAAENALRDAQDAPALTVDRGQSKYPGLNPAAPTMTFRSPSAQTWTGKLSPPPKFSTSPSTVSTISTSAPTIQPAPSNTETNLKSVPGTKERLEEASIFVEKPAAPRGGSGLWDAPNMEPREFDGQMTLESVKTGEEPNKTRENAGNGEKNHHPFVETPKNGEIFHHVSPAKLTAAKETAGGEEGFPDAEPPVPPLSRPDPAGSPALHPPVSSASAPLPHHFPTPFYAGEGETPWRVIGELFSTYIVVEQGENVIFIDKHAAHERLGFDRLKSGNYRPMTQQLLQPQAFPVSPEQKTALLEHVADLEEFGFSIQDFGETLAVRAIPDFLTPAEAPSALEELAEEILTHGTANPCAARDELLHSMACKAAAKAGQKNAPAELTALAREVLSGAVKHCPHGRPVMTIMTQKELEKAFKRVL